ncbi:hypothetical protein LDVICp136 [lymphocystis disease virus-China]|uniref:Uncharacterized protein n=2 Tax=Lymphocystis disease virus 2 TaxID=159183 RepID=A0A6F8X1P0_9VIRU|nr:hypothetical protein LDVICp136 [lymphocystis disease virus-China]AAU10981.1 hypothetical protein [lymphocystis disease virus-China]BCB67490.1 hypothetical protein [Lymphocystis disease virus 2]
MYHIDVLNRLLIKNFCVLTGKELSDWDIKFYISQMKPLIEDILNVVEKNIYRFQPCESNCDILIVNNYKLNFISTYVNLIAVHKILFKEHLNTLNTSEKTFRMFIQRLTLFYNMVLLYTI